MIAPYSAPMGVYSGQQRIGEIVDHGKKTVMAYLTTASGRVLLGSFPDRKAAMCAVSNAAKEPPGPEAT